jgi:hypothetical protein
MRVPCTQVLAPVVTAQDTESKSWAFKMSSEVGFEKMSAEVGLGYAAPDAGLLER